MRYNDNRNEIYRQQWNSNKEIKTQEKHNEYRRRMSKSNTWEREVPKDFCGKEGTEQICYRCNKVGHIAKDCSMRENRKCFICKRVDTLQKTVDTGQYHICKKGQTSRIRYNI